MGEDIGMADRVQPPLTRIQQKNRDLILEGALSVFSVNGFRGATIDQIAEAAGLSKPNVLYYFASKDDIHKTLLTTLLDMWLAPMIRIDPAGDPLEEVLGVLEEDRRISILVLATATEGGPGPLVSALAGRHAGRLRCPMTIVPGGMDDAELDRVT